MRRTLVLAAIAAACATGGEPSRLPEGAPELVAPLPAAEPRPEAPTIAAASSGSRSALESTPASGATPAGSVAPAPVSADASPAQTSSSPAPPVRNDASPAQAGPPSPPPLPAPGPAPIAPPPAADLSDPLELLWGHKLDFAGGGEPLVTIRLMEGQSEIAFRARAAAKIGLRGGSPVEVPAGARLTVRVRGAVPAAIVWHPLLAEAPISGRDRLERQRRAYDEKGVAVHTRIVGGVYGIGGRVVDNRRELLLADSAPTEAGALAVAERLRELNVRLALDAEVVARPRGKLELRAEGGAPLGEADTALWMEVERDGGFVVENVEHERGPRGRAREDRNYRGRLYVTLDAEGKLAAVHAVTLEELLRGLVPSEMPAFSHLEALKAQAVTARSNVLAQVGSRHLTDPFMLCAEVHCQAYRGDAARTARTDQAVRATRGEALFGREDRTLVDGVYSAMCGGHGEDNEKVWGGAPNPSLRGHADLPRADAARWENGLDGEARLRAFLNAPIDAWCRRPAAASKDRFRWQRRLGPAALARVGESLGIGRVSALNVEARGVSGRTRLLEVVGDAGRAEVSGELRIRRLLDDLPSAMFVVDRVGESLMLRGGGWGHGAGMCQWGAVGRAEAGQGYREILGAYFSGADVARVY